MSTRTLSLAIFMLLHDPEANSAAYDNVADLLTGLEPHCLKNSKFSGD